MPIWKEWNTTDLSVSTAVNYFALKGFAHVVVSKSRVQQIREKLVAIETKQSQVA